MHWHPPFLTAPSTSLCWRLSSLFSVNQMRQSSCPWFPKEVNTYLNSHSTAVTLHYRKWKFIFLFLQENPDGRSVFKDEAVEVLLESLSSQENFTAQALAASFLSNLGGTYSWSGESYTAAWLSKKAGLTSKSHRNMIRNIDWQDACLQVKYKNIHYLLA